jgi:hypothetical protein
MEQAQKQKQRWRQRHTSTSSRAATLKTRSAAHFHESSRAHTALSTPPATTQRLRQPAEHRSLTSRGSRILLLLATPTGGCRKRRLSCTSADVVADRKRNPPGAVG